MDAFSAELGHRLQSYGQELERTALPTLKSQYRNFTSILTAFLEMLKKKGLISDDPYHYDEKISEISPVSNEPFLEAQRATVLTIRLHNFANQLNFLNDFYQFSLDYLTLARLKVMSQFTRFVRWDALSETSNEINTRIVAEIVARLRRGEDGVLSGLINDMVGQLGTYQTKILEGLKRINFYKREEYKSLIRSTFWEAMNLSPEELAGNADNVQRRIRKEFAAHVKGQPFVPELIKELLDEDLSASGRTLREDLLRKLKVDPEVREQPKQKADYKQTLMEAIRTLASLNVPLEAALKKLRENTLLYEDDRLTLGKRFRRWIRSLMGIKARPKVYEIEIFEPSSATTKVEQLDFEKFSEEVLVRVRIMVNLANRASPQFQALVQKGESEILESFDRSFLDSSRFNERLLGLDLFFKTETPKEKRSRVRGVKAEIAQIKTILSNSNKLKHEYVAAREEQEQLKRLGIAVNG